MEMLIFVLWDRRPRCWPARPRLYKPFAARATCLDQEGSWTHCCIADLEVQDGLGSCVRPQSRKRRLKRVLHDRGRQRTWRVVAAGAPALVGRLQKRGAGSSDMTAR